MAHAYHPRTHDPSAAGDEPILFDGCDECKFKAGQALQAFDRQVTTALWRKMVEVEHEGGRYRSRAEATACRTMYGVAVFLEHHTRLDPWTLFDDTQEAR